MKRRTFLPSRLANLWRVLCLALAWAVLTGTAQAQGYQVKPGDTLRIEVLEDASLNRTVLVAPDGRISVPQAGTLSVRGQTVEAIQSQLVQRLASNFANTPNVFVSIEQLAAREQRIPSAPAPAPMISVYLVGEVANPGRVEVEPGTSVLQMFAIMGGFTRFAATKRIQLRSDNSGTVRQLNYDIIERGGQGGTTRLHDGDVIVVPQRKLFE